MFVAIWFFEEIDVVDDRVGGTESQVEFPGEVADFKGVARCTDKIIKGLRGIVYTACAAWGYRDPMG